MKKNLTFRLLLGVVAALVVALPAVAQADAQQTQAAQLTIKPFANLGEVCNTNRGADVYVTGTRTVLYWVPFQTVMRIENWAGPSFYIAHAQGKPNGEIERSAIEQSSCHST